MFTKFKQAVENWLRSLVADEVRKVNGDLQCERATLRAQLAQFEGTIKAQLQSFDEALSRLVEMSFFRENSELRDHIAQLNGQITGISDTFKRLHP